MWAGTRVSGIKGPAGPGPLTERRWESPPPQWDRGRNCPTEVVEPVQNASPRRTAPMCPATGSALYGCPRGRLRLHDPPMRTHARRVRVRVRRLTSGVIALTCSEAVVAGTVGVADHHSQRPRRPPLPCANVQAPLNADYLTQGETAIKAALGTDQHAGSRHRRCRGTGDPLADGPRARCSAAPRSGVHARTGHRRP